MAHRDLKDLGLRLLYADSEKEVEEIIGDPIFSSKRNWVPLDNRDTNFNIVTNQSSTGGKAATELITNMVDAILTRRCLETNIDPKGPDAPKTMYKAVDKFIQNLNGGRIISADKKWLRQYAEENLIIAVTGKKGAKPCYIFADNGEGQNPQDFPATFLSLSAKNKSEIPFVQGKYNMGSSGVLNFCGQHWFKLIISRRYDRKGEWGWTLVRKRPQSNPLVAEYFSIDGKTMPTLGDIRLVYPLYKDGERIERFSLESGTVIKLYDFHVGKKFKAFKGAREAFNENLVETILPFLLLDLRYLPDPKRGAWRRIGVDDRRFYGMEFLLLRSHADEADSGDDEDDDAPTPDSDTPMQIDTVTDIRLGKVSVTAIQLKGQKKSNWFNKSNSRIFHHVNGQVQFKETRGLLSRCKLNAIQDRVAIMVNASELHDAAHQEIWQGDRESIRENELGEHYLATVRDIITNSAMLKKWNHQVAKEELDAAAQESSRDIIRDLVSKDRNLALLIDGKTPDIPGGAGTHTPQTTPVSYDGRYSPTFIRFEDPRSEIEIAINKGRPIICRTDVVNDWLTRPDNQGDILFENEYIGDYFIIKRNLDNGRLVLFLKPDDDRVKVGDTYSLRVGLQDPAMPMAIMTEDKITIKIVPEIQRSRNPSPHPRPRPEASRGLPTYRLLTKDGRQLPNYGDSVGWDSPDVPFSDFSEKDGGFVKDLGEGKIYYINYDNSFFLSSLYSEKNDTEREALAQKYILGMRILLLGFEHAINTQYPQGPQEDILENIEIFRRMAAMGAASVVLTICHQLPRRLDFFNDNSETSE